MNKRHRLRLLVGLGLVLALCLSCRTTKTGMRAGVYAFNLSDQGDRATYGLYIPSKPSNRLLVWLGPNRGSSDVSEVPELLDDAYVLTGDYLDRQLPRIAVDEGRIGEVVGALSHAIAKVLKRFPDIDPKQSVIAGYSSGSHAIMSALEAEDETFLKFRTFVIHEGGLSNVRSGRCLDGVEGELLFSIGDASPARTSWLTKYERATACGKTTSLMQHPGLEHYLNHEVVTRVRAWLKKRWTRLR